MDSQLTFTCSGSTIEKLEKGVKYVQSKQLVNVNDVVLVFFLLTYFTPFSSFYFAEFDQANVSWVYF